MTLQFNNRNNNRTEIKACYGPLCNRTPVGLKPDSDSVTLPVRLIYFVAYCKGVRVDCGCKDVRVDCGCKGVRVDCGCKGVGWTVDVRVLGGLWM